MSTSRSPIARRCCRRASKRAPPSNGDQCWDGINVGAAGRIVGMKTFGASAALKELQRKFGFEPERIVATAMELIGR